MHESPTEIILTTERLTIRLPQFSDVDRLVAFAVENHDHLAPWEPLRADEYFTTSFWREDVESARRELLHGRGLRLIMLLRDDPGERIIGRINYNNIVRGVFQACHLGYALGAEAQGLGLMAEALQATNAFVFDELGLHRIMANYMPQNNRSSALLKRLGFVEEGLAREYLQIAGRWEDHVLTSLINENYERREGSYE